MSVRLENITKRFGKKEVIRNFSLSLEKGERALLIAPSGSGKTTLFRIISGLENRFEGKREIDGEISYMFQEDRLFEHVTVIDNVTLLDYDKSAKAKELLERLGLFVTENLFPSELSGGMKRRVALARVLLRDADILLLDEPFTGLDDESVKEAAEVISEYTLGKTLLIISHNPRDAELLSLREINFN